MPFSPTPPVQPLDKSSCSLPEIWDRSTPLRVSSGLDDESPVSANPNPNPSFSPVEELQLTAKEAERVRSLPVCSASRPGPRLRGVLSVSPDALSARVKAPDF